MEPQDHYNYDSFGHCDLGGREVKLRNLRSARWMERKSHWLTYSEK